MFCKQLTIPDMPIVRSAGKSLVGKKLTSLTASRCVYCKLWKDLGFFCSANHLSEGGVNANHNVMCSLNFTENDSRLLKNREGNWDEEWIFVTGRRQMLLYSCKWQEQERSEKSAKQIIARNRMLINNEPWNTKLTKQIKIQQSQSTNQNLLNSCK